MKALVLTSIFLISFLFSIGQVSEIEKSMVNGSQNALSITLKDADDKYARKVWSKFLEKHSGKTKKVKKSKEYLTPNVKIYKISDTEKINVYSNFSDSSDGATGVFWFDIGGEYLSSYNDKKAYKEAEKFLLKYALAVKVSQTQDLLKSEGKKLKKLEGNLNGLKKDHGKYVKTIEDSHKKIAKAEQDIERNIVDQENASESILDKQEVINTIMERLNDLKR